MTVEPRDGAPSWMGPGHRLAASRGAQMRVSTADRDRASDLLAKAFAEGRLTPEEHSARVDKAMSAVTFADLDAITADLPGTAPVRPPGTNQMAIGSFVAGIGQFAFGPFCTIPAIVLGHLARKQIRRTGEQGDGMAVAGLALGYVGAVLEVLAVLAVVLIILAVTPT